MCPSPKGAKPQEQGPGSIPGMFVAYEHGSQAYRVRTARGLKVSRDAEFSKDANGAILIDRQEHHYLGQRHVLTGDQL